MSDRNLLSFGPDVNGSRYDCITDLDGLGYNDTVKCSGVTNFAGHFAIVKSGSEDAADINNRSEGVSLIAALWVLRGSMGFTVKGGSRDTHLEGPVAGQGRETDVDLGNWSDQSHEKTTETHLNLWRIDRSPIRVRVLHADAPTFEPGSGPYRYVFPSPKLGPLHTAIIWGFMILRRWGFFR